MIRRLFITIYILLTLSYCSGNNLRYYSSNDEASSRLAITEISLEVQNLSAREKVVCCYTEPPVDLAQGCLFQSSVKEAVKDTQYDLTEPPEQTVQRIAAEFFQQQGISVNPRSSNRLIIEIERYELNLQGNNMRSVVRFRFRNGSNSILKQRGQEGYNMWGKSSMEETMALNISHLLDEIPWASLFAEQ
tara:strand:- start:108 stop:677 length:570 start_codon:yes stop_codon:yes gene_type:complete